MNSISVRNVARASIACTAIVLWLAVSGCASDGYSGGGSTSVSVGYGYGSGTYYGPYYGGGYYDPYPPVVVVPPGQRPDRPNGGDRPTTLPAEVSRPSTRPAMAPPRPPTSYRPTSRPAPRPATRPMPRAGGMRR